MSQFLSQNFSWKQKIVVVAVTKTKLTIILSFMILYNPLLYIEPIISARNSYSVKNIQIHTMLTYSMNEFLRSDSFNQSTFLYVQ